MIVTKHRWITVPTYAANVEDMSDDRAYRQIREGTFPFRFVRFGRQIRIDAADAGLYEEPQNSEARKQGETLREAA